MKDKERPGRSSKFEHQQLLALSDEDSCQSEKQLSIRLGVAQQTVSDRLHTIGKILNKEIWVPHELKETQQ